MKLFTPKKKTEEKKTKDDSKTSPPVTEETVNSSQTFDRNIEKQDKNKDASISKEEKIPDTSQSESIQENKTLSDTDTIKKIIETVSNSDEKSIIPYIDFEANRIAYPILKKADHDEYDVGLLEKLASESSGVLEKFIYERWIVCPQHQEELSVNVRRYCPECSSMDIERLQLIEHRVCGYIAEMDKYGVKSTSELQKCPSCKRQIKNLEKEIRMPGRWNRCNSCNKRFDNVIFRMHCRKFNHDFNTNEVEAVPIFYYKIKSQANENFATVNILPPIKKKLESLGFTVEELSIVKGKSGIGHQTNIFAQKNNKTIAIFIRTAKDFIDDAVVNSVLVNVLDISPTQTIFIAIPAITDAAKAMAVAHGIKVVTGSDFKQMTADVDEILSEDTSTNSRVETT